MSARCRVLLASCGDECAQALARLLTQCGLETLSCSTLRELQALLPDQTVDLIFCATQLNDGSFREVLRAVEVASSPLPVVVFSRVGEPEEYLEAMRLGAFDFIAPPYRCRELDWIVSNAVGRMFSAACGL